MLRVIFNKEAGNYDSKTTFITSLIKQEKLVFILVILYVHIYVFLQIVFTNRFPISAIRFPNIRVYGS